MAIIPVGYILTNEAIEELVGADPHHRRLKAEWQAATGQAKAKAYIDVCERQNQLTDRLFEDVKSRKLLAIALKRMAPSGGWVEHNVPARYLETLGGDLAFWTGSVERLGLDPEDLWMADAPLCYRRSDFDDWLASTIVLRPLGAQELPTWWTVPEASVWIATRDLSKVQALDARSRAWLFIAGHVVPGAFEASFELLAGLREGRLLASGWHRGQQSGGVGERVQSPYWKAPTEFSDGKTGVEAVRGPGDAMVGLLLESDDVMTRWESPQSLLDGEKIPLGVAIGRLMREDPPSYLLRHPEVCLTGLNDRGEKVEIDKDVLRTNAKVNRATHAITTADGRLHWSAVMVELRKQPKADAKPHDGNRPLSKGESVDPRELELNDWGIKVCAAVKSAGRRIAKGAFVGVAWEHFGTTSGLTADGIAAAWTKARRSAGWPEAGTIPTNARIEDADLRSLLIEARLLTPTA